MMQTQQLVIDFARAQGERAAQACIEKAQRVADPAFKEKATQAILNHLKAVRRASGEELTDVAIAHGARPHDARAFGPVFRALLGSSQIRVVDTCPRVKGHGSSGGKVYALCG